MSLRTAHAALRPALRLAASSRAPLAALPPRLALISPSASSSPLLVRTKKTKAKKPAQQDDDDFDPAPPAKGKGKKGGKGHLLTEDQLLDTQLPGEQFELKRLEADMENAVDRLRVGLKQVVGRVGRVSPALLDNIRVDTPEGKRPLNEFASVSVKDGKDLLVTCYEEDGVKPVTAAIYASPLNLTPQPAGSTSIRVPVPKPDWDKRQQLVRDAQALCEKARIAVRQVRTDGQKEIKRDQDSKVVGKEEARAEGKKLDDATKKKTAEVDRIFEEAKRIRLLTPAFDPLPPHEPPVLVTLDPHPLPVMCRTGAHLFYGMTVPLVELAVAATAFLKQRDSFLAIDLILARRRKGILRGMASGLQPEQTVFQVPEEVWMLIMDELAAVLWEEAEDMLVRHWHIADDDDDVHSGYCMCTVCGEGDEPGEPNTLPNRFTFAHFKDCPSCDYGFRGAGGMDELRDRVYSDIKAMLGRFGLTMLEGEPISHSGMESPTLVDAFIAVILPQYASIEYEDVHEPGDTTRVHTPLSLIPALFALPDDVDSRFARLLRNFPNLGPEQKQDIWIVGVSSTSSLMQDLDGRPAEQAGNAPVKKPAWGVSIWSESC
ncbi:hypothetical protein JCM10450v2_001293 [Rhodotorula kratochvilovae]